MATSTISSLTNTNTIDATTVFPADYSGATYKVSANTLGSFITTNAVTITATGNIVGGNILTVGLVSATGNIAGNYFIGNGSQLTGISASGGASNARVMGYSMIFGG